MANIYAPGLTENIRQKNVAKCFPTQMQKNRTALQPLCVQQQNSKQQKQNGERTKCAARKLQENKPPLPISLSQHPNKIIKNSVLSKPNILRCDNREYEEEIFAYLLSSEQRTQRIKPHYMTKQVHLTWDMRSVLVDWLVSVSDEFKINESTLHLSVNFVDRFLSNISVIREKFQLVGATAMMIAGKVEEIFPPHTKEWSYLTGDAFSVRQIIKMEQLMLRSLNFEINAPTAADFIKHMCFRHKLDQTTMHLAMYLSELVLLEGKGYLQYFPSKLAASSLLLARHTLLKSEPWTTKLEETSGYSVRQLSPVVQKQYKTFKNSPFKQQQAVQKKYASEKYQKVSLLKPRVLVLDEEEE